MCACARECGCECHPRAPSLAVRHAGDTTRRDIFGRLRAAGRQASGCTHRAARRRWTRTARHSCSAPCGSSAQERHAMLQIQCVGWDPEVDCPLNLSPLYWVVKFKRQNPPGSQNTTWLSTKFSCSLCSRDAGGRLCTDVQRADLLKLRQRGIVRVVLDDADVVERGLGVVVLCGISRKRKSAPGPSMPHSKFAPAPP